MAFGTNSFRFGITKKLLAWCLVLITIFYVMTFYLFMGIRDLVLSSERIVKNDFAMVALTEQSMDILLRYLENSRKYEILGRDEYLIAAREDLESFIATTSLHASMLQLLPELPMLKEELAQANMTDEQPVMFDEERIGRWIDGIAQERLKHLELINERVHEIYVQGAEAQKWGLTGLAAATFFGVAASLGMALHLNRSLRELGLGIQRMSSNEEFQPIQIQSSDELGALAKAFNEMSERLRIEERMRADFISMLSHEIRTPLTSIREAISLVQEKILGEVNQAQTSYLNIAQNETRRLSDLLVRLMQISQLGATRLELSLQPFPLQDLVMEAIQRVRPVAVKNQVTVSIDFLPANVLVQVDRDHIQQVLFNLLGNAVKFSAQGAMVQIRADILDAQKRVKICVSDRGPGISEEDRQFVFQRYFRGAAAKEITDGAGLGLSISRQIVEAHSGQLWLEESSAQGSVFCFTLPLL